MEELDPDRPYLQGEDPGVDLGEAVAKMVNEMAAREDGPTTLRKVEIDGQETEFRRTRYQAALEKGKLAVDEAIDYTAEHPVRIFIGTIAIGVLLHEVKKHYVGKGPSLSKKHRRQK